MESWDLAGTQVIGGTRPLDDKVAFAHARVVLGRPPVEKEDSEECLLVYRYPSPMQAEGELMTLSDWQDLISAGQAHQLKKPFPASYNGTLWLLGNRFPKRDQIVKELSDAGALIDSYKDDASDVFVCYINAELGAEIRERAAEIALAAAWLKTSENAWDEAVPQAELALAIGDLSAERVALLALLYERQGKLPKSKAYLRMGLNSRGQKFYEDTIQKFKSFDDRIKESQPSTSDTAREVVPVGPRIAKREFNQALHLLRGAADPRSRDYNSKLHTALSHAERAIENGGSSPEHVALLSLLHERLGNKKLAATHFKVVRYRQGEDFYEETLKKYRDLSTLNERVKRGLEPTSQLVYFTAGMVAALIVLVIVLVNWTIPAYAAIPLLNNTLNLEDAFNLLRRLSATILVLFMQFGFIAFEAGYVRQSYRRASAIKNLIVFAISFISYMFFGWIIQRRLSGHAFTLLDISFNAGFASTVALIIANTITERGTLLINSLFSVLAAGVAYPILAGLIFDHGPFTAYFGFVDTAGGCVVHVLGGAFGLAAAILIGPRMKRRAWYRLGKVQIAEQRDSFPLAVIGAFFLWFGWLGFNSGNATTWNEYFAAFANTNIGASAGGLVGLIIAVSNMARLTRTASSDLISRGWWRDGLRDTASLERVIIGMMGGLVSVTANASVVKPWQALIEATLGATVAIVGSAFLIHMWERLDDPLGAIATHGFAGTVGVLCTAIFYHPHNRLLTQLGIQALGWAIAIFVGGALATGMCAILWGVERRRKGSALWLYGKVFRLTAYEQINDSTGTEFWSRNEAIERARARVRTTPPMLQEDVDEEWISAVAVLALSDEPEERLGDLFTAVDTLLETSCVGRPEEQAAIAAIRARVRVKKLLMCVDRALDHRDPRRRLKALDWNKLGSDYQNYPDYRETLIVTMTDLAESFAADYRIRRVAESPTDLKNMIVGFVKACDLLEQIGQEKQAGEKLRKRAETNFFYLRRLPWYSEIRKKYDELSLAVSPIDAPSIRVHDVEIGR